MVKNHGKSKTSKETRLLLTAVRLAGEAGWKNDLLAKAAQECGIDEAAANTLFPDGTTSLITAFANWADAEMQSHLKKNRTKKHRRVRDQVALGVKTRLEILTPYKNAIQKSLVIATCRPHLKLTLGRSLWATADKIWIFAGDTSDDYNRYTKRALLSGVITATTLYWLQDSSKGHADTWEFLEKRIDNVMKAGQTLSSWIRRVA